jgi:hypothetical protein
VNWKPMIVIFSRSDRWRNALEFYGKQTFEQIQFVCLADIQECVRTIMLRQPALAIFEGEVQDAKQICELIRLHYAQLGSTVLVAVGDHQLAPWIPLLQSSGFADVCADMTQLSHFVQRIERHLRLAVPNHAEWIANGSLEQKIKDQLPW